MSTDTITSISDLTGIQKSAVLLMALGTERAAQVLRTMREHEITAIMGEVAKLDGVPASVTDAVLAEFEAASQVRRQATVGGQQMARELLEISLGSDRAGEIVDRMSTVFVAPPFDFVTRVDPRMLLSYLRDEHPQTIALVLAHLPGDAATRVLTGLDDEEQRDIAIRIAEMGSTSPEVVNTVEETLRERLSAVSEHPDIDSAGGIESLIDVLTNADPELEQKLLEGLEAHDPELANEVRAKMFVFADIVGIDDRSVQQILRQVEARDLAKALKGVHTDVRQKVLSNLSTRAAEDLEVEIEVLGAVRLSDVEEAQAMVIAVIRKMEEDGQLVLARGNDEMVE